MRPYGAYGDIEFSDPERIREVQETLLREHVAYCIRHSPYYRGRLAALGTDLESLTLETLSGLPLTDKGDLARHNDDFLAVAASRVVDMVLSSGTTGVPTRVMYTDRDLERLAYNEYRSFCGLGMTADDVVLLTCTLDRCFVAGLAYFLGVRRVGAAAIRGGHGSMESHMRVMEQMRPTVAVGVPTFLRKLGQYLDGQGMKAAESPVHKLVCIGEPVRDGNLELLKLGSDLESLWSARAYSTYASSETVTTFCECTAQCGGHLHPDLAIVEIVDDEGRVLPPGGVGEVVVTPLAVEGMPLIRFKTGDVSFLIEGPCGCGRRSARLGPIVGRKQQMMKVRGTSLYPQALYSALDRIPGMGEYFITVDSEDELSDHVTVHVAVDPGGCTAGEIGEKLQACLRVKPDVVVETDEAVRSRVFSPQSRKPVRFVDKRRRPCRAVKG